MIFNIKENEITYNGENYIREANTKYAESQDEIGYLAEGLPTDTQIELQDILQQKIEDFMKSVHKNLIFYGLEPLDLHYNVQTNFDIIESIWKHYKLDKDFL